MAGLRSHPKAGSGRAAPKPTQVVGRVHFLAALGFRQLVSSKPVTDSLWLQQRPGPSQRPACPSPSFEKLKVNWLEF